MIKEQLDYERPCPECGEPWAVVYQGVTMAESDQPVAWAAVRGHCSTGAPHVRLASD